MQRPRPSQVAVLVLAGAWSVAPACAHTPSGDAEQGAWSLDPLVIFLLAVAVLLYSAGMRRLRARSRHGLARLSARSAYFTLGILLTIAALLTPIDTLGAELFSMHMVQHELLMVAAAPLLVLSRPLPIFLWALAERARLRVGRLSRFAAASAAWDALTRPLTAWLLHAAALWVWHVPVLFEESLRSPGVHALQHFAFLASALLFWSVLIGPRPLLRAGSAVVFLLTTAMHTAILGALLTLSSTLWYPVYMSTSGKWGLSALEDQQLGGLIMWVPAGIVFIAAGLSAVARLLGPDGPGPEAQGRR